MTLQIDETTLLRAALFVRHHADEADGCIPPWALRFANAALNAEAEGETIHEAIPAPERAPLLLAEADIETSREIIALRAEKDRLRGLIGEIAPDAPPDEWFPRDATWHLERANWQAEVQRLTAALDTVRAELNLLRVERESGKASLKDDPVNISSEPVENAPQNGHVAPVAPPPVRQIVLSEAEPIDVKRERVTAAQQMIRAIFEEKGEFQGPDMEEVRKGIMLPRDQLNTLVFEVRKQWEADGQPRTAPIVRAPKFVEPPPAPKLCSRCEKRPRINAHPRTLYCLQCKEERTKESLEASRQKNGART